MQREPFVKSVAALTMTFSFGLPAAGAPAAGGAFGSTFGAAASSAPPAFGASTATTASTGFGGFGATKPAATGFGAATTGAFGAPASTAGGFSGFGATAGTTSTFGKPAGGLSFGAPAASTAPSFGGFGGGSFGTTTTTSKPGGLFGGGTTSFGGGTTSFGGGLGTTGGAFGTTGGAYGTTGGAFGTTGGAFGTTGGAFGASAGGLGGTTGGMFGGGAKPGGFSAPQQLQQQPAGQPGQAGLEQLYNSVLHCSLFGDERDSVIARWNMLAASTGVGKAFYSNNAPPLDLTPENPLCRFKTIGYSALPSSKSEDGLIGGVIKKKAAELSAVKDQIAGGIQNALGNKPGIKVVVDEIRDLNDGESSQVTFYVQETGANGQVRRVPTNEIYGFLSQPMNAQNLQKLGMTSVTPKVAFTQKQIKEYLENPPQGIDPRLWKQAQLENPDPKKFIPVPMIGFKTLQQRIAKQDQQAKMFHGRLDSVAGNISDLQKRHQDTLSKIREAKRRHLELSHRVLHVLVKQEETRKTGFTIQVRI